MTANCLGPKAAKQHPNQNISTHSLRVHLHRLKKKKIPVHLVLPTERGGDEIGAIYDFKCMYCDTNCCKSYLEIPRRDVIFGDFFLASNSPVGLNFLDW